MTALPNDWLALLLVVYSLGLRHGMDADHLATIDGMARANAASRPLLSRWCGALFSLGHGAVVMAVTIIVGVATQAWQPPVWLDTTGAWISIAFLTLLGVLNVYGVAVAKPGDVVRIAGFRSRWVAGLSRVNHPLLIASVGALFALSFDTVSQVALFSLTASSMSGLLFSMALGAVFTLGMLTTDGINGLWVSKLLARADRRAMVCSRMMGLIIGSLSLLVAAYGVARQLHPSVAAYSEGRALAFGLLVVAVVAISFVIAMRLSPVPETARAVKVTTGI